MSLRQNTAIKKLLWTMSLNLTTNCYYVLFSQQHLGKNTESWKWSVYRPFVGIPTTVAALLLGAWSVCPASTIFSDTVRLLSLSLSLVMDIKACLHVFLSLRNVHNRLFTVPAPTILVEEGRVCNHYSRSDSVPTEASTGDRI